MTDRPILFSAPMVRALLDGRKTQTRRGLTPQPEADFIEAAIGRDEMMLRPAFLFGGPTHDMLRRLPRPGSRMWVRESYYQRGHWAPVDGARTKGGRQKWGFVPADDDIVFNQPAGEVRLGRHSASPSIICWHKRLGRFMPRTASRMTLTVTDVHIGRLLDISEEDAWAEGCKQGHPDDVGGFFPAEEPDPSGIGFRGWDSARDWYADLWDAINGEGAWDANPWIVAYTFTVERRNIDAAAAEAHADG